MGQVIAFIPVRGNSKSIPLKNIKEFCGKPLVYWNIKALEFCPKVDKIVVATDSPKIEEVVASFKFSKVELYHRSDENATDTASTESVMLEYIGKQNLANEDIFMLVQATSPLTQTIHFTEALCIYEKGEYDSMLTCVRNFRFYWNEDGTSKNYDYRNRPRRQDFKGTLMENGAFYINTVSNILRDKNRLSGKIGIYEMPEYTATEIDEPDDWIILENLMRRHVLGKRKPEKIKLFLTDVDGVLTDGGMYYSENGDEMKRFSTYDGMGMQLLREKGVKVGIITSEDTKMVQRRGDKLKVDYLFQGRCAGGKLETAQYICKNMGISLDEVAYIGDDINCFEILSNVGLAACPANAMPLIKSIPGILVLSKSGGQGAVREFAEIIMESY